MCFENNDLVPYSPHIDKRDCFKCWRYNYYDKFYIFPGIRCTIQTCEDCLEGKYDYGNHVGDCCCNTNPRYEPPCAWFSCCLCPIAMIGDIISCPLRKCGHAYYTKKELNNTPHNNIKIIDNNNQPQIDNITVDCIEIQPKLNV